MHSSTTNVQIGTAQPVQEIPEILELATAIFLGKHKQGEFWMEGSGQVSCLPFLVHGAVVEG